MKQANKVFSFRLPVLFAGVFLALNVQAVDSSKHGPAAFSEFDIDNNGKVSEEEFTTVRAKRMADKATEGRNMKGAATAPSFGDIDTDGDGSINPEELTTAQKAHMAERHKMAGGQGHGNGHGKSHGNGLGHGMTDERSVKPCGGMKGNMPAFSDFDLDGDGKISESEFNKAHAERMSKMASEGKKMKHANDTPGFSGIDTDGNGEISKDEFQTHQAEHHYHNHGVKDNGET